jgi:hypothetical protein
MPSTAISAQNTKFEIETGTGGAKTITAIQIGNPTIITSAAHGQANGNVVSFASITGTVGTSLLNGLSLVITNVTANTFAVQVDSTGLAYTSGGSATPVTYTEIANVKSYSGFDGAASEIDVTNLRSTAKEKRLGLQDFGKFSMNINPDFSDSGQNAVRASKGAGTQKNYRVTYPNTKVASFAAYVKSTPESGGVDAVIDGSVELTITGAVTVA